MSILNEQREEPNYEKRAATRIKRQSKRLAESIIRDWEQSFDLLWNNPKATPERVLSELGTDAAEVFELSDATVQFMGQILPGKLDDAWDRVQKKLEDRPATTVHDDGTVTID